MAIDSTGAEPEIFQAEMVDAVHETAKKDDPLRSTWPEDLQDDTAVDNERCGICTDIVIDRGVLDCCKHWFCFACIDNWATITNLCPLCKNEFQLITCLPVYDTIGNIKTEDYSFTRDDDWCIQGKNNTLSFPSYYIDEDAVICLDGDGCKIRNGFSVAEEDLTFDTSIACDSCDIWYHALCVGFNPECGTSESSWLCPRCISNEAQRKSDVISSQNLVNHSALHADTGWVSHASFSSKVSVSVADAGETAVVVSMVEAQQKPEHDNISQYEVELGCNTDEDTRPFLYETGSGNVNFNVKPENSGSNELKYNSLSCGVDKESKASAPESDKKSEILFITPETCLEENLLALSSHEDTSSELRASQSEDTLMQPLTASPEGVPSPPCYSVTDCNLKNNNADGTTSNPLSSDDVNIPSVLLCDTSDTKKISDINFHIDMSVSTSSELRASQSEDTLRQLLTASPECVSSPPCHSVTDCNLNNNNADGTTSNPPSSDDVKIPSLLLCDTSDAKNQSSDINFHIDMSDSTSSVYELAGNDIKCQIPESSSKPSSERITPVIKTSVHSGTDTSDILPKPVEVSDLAGEPTEKQSHVNDAGCLRKTEMDTQYPVKKAKSEGNPQLILSRRQANASVLENSKRCSRDVPLNNGITPKRKLKSPDIMSIVQEDNRPNDCQGAAHDVNKSATKRENTSGPRVKKIMRRVGEKEESSVLVQKLSKEIREAVLDKTSNNNVIDNDFDGKLLSAFRAAIVKPRNELVNKNIPSCGSLKKSLLQRGKTRENLTKKIYGTSTGKRKRAWDRDWEIEFWKHRCARNKDEKVDTLYSVLALLKRATNSCPNDSETGEGPEGETNSILSRVYLADNSVFPRKDDIKPLSILAGSSQTVEETNMEKSPTGVPKCLPQGKAVPFDNTGKQSSSLSSVAEASCGKEKSLTDSRGTKGRVHGPPKELASQSDSSKVDKRKWALEVLARKNASMNSNARKGNEVDKSALKGNYPILAQLPLDMRPMPTPSSHNKVPLSVRQAQLYRITEHYLRRTNLTIIRRTADTELAVADAVNIEKGIFERSNSKLVYINLCSQAVSQRSKDPPSAETTSSNNSEPTVEVANEVAKETSSEPSIVGWSKIEDALKLAGLSSDSPPDSPCKSPIKDIDIEVNPNGSTKEQGIENVLDVDSHPELDIYGDFEYDLDDEGYEASKLPQQQNRDSKLKVVLSTVGHDEASNVQNSKPENSDMEVVTNDQVNGNVRIEDSAENEVKESKMAASLVPKPSEGEMHEELSLLEYEELYGPDDLLLANKIPDELTGEKSKSMEMIASGKSIIPCESGNNQSRDGATTYVFNHEDCVGISSAHDVASLNNRFTGGENSPASSLASESAPLERKVKLTCNNFHDPNDSIFKKVEAYVKEHIRPLCKSGVITVDQYRWAVGKTTDKVMKYHHKAKNANFLIKEGKKVKKLAEQYVEAAQQKDS